MSAEMFFFERVMLTASDTYDAMRNSWAYQRLIKPIRYAGRPRSTEAPPPRLRPYYIKPKPSMPLDISSTDSPERIEVIEQVRSVPAWYHTINLPHGVSTPGLFDHRPALHLYGLPGSLSGKQCLDVATFDGFWAFEMEARGGKVSALDLPDMRDWDIPPVYRARYLRNNWSRPTRSGFEVAHELRSSRVERHEMSVYQLAPETLGMFDVVYCGDLLLHLRDPNRALQCIRSVTREYALLVDCVHPLLMLAPFEGMVYLGGREDCVWWCFKPSTLAGMLYDAGFSHVELLQLFRLDYVDGRRGPWRSVFKATV